MKWTLSAAFQQYSIPQFALYTNVALIAIQDGADVIKCHEYKKTCQQAGIIND